MQQKVYIATAVRTTIGNFGGLKLSDATLIGDIIFDGLWCPYSKKDLKICLENAY